MMRQKVANSLKQFHFGKADPSDPDMRQRKIRRAIAAEAARGAWGAGFRDVSKIDLQGGSDE